MSNNTQLNPGGAGDVMRTIDKGGVKTQVVVLDLGGSGTESLPSNNALTTIDYVHQKVHEGRFFSGGHYIASVANNGVLEILFQTDSTHNFHGIAEAFTGGDAIMQMYMGVTFSSAGTNMPMTNHNTASTKVISGATHTPTITGTGTQLNGTIFIPGGGFVGSGGSGGFSREFILKPSTAYLLRITNISGAAQPISATASGYIPDL